MNRYARLRAERLPLGLCVRCGKNPVVNGATNCTECKKKNSQESCKRNAKYKKQVVDAYGGKCACCGETNIKFLTVDHIFGGGGKEREGRTGGNRIQYYLDIIKAEFPKHLQILCYNCNCGRDKNGGICPHKDAIYSIDN